MRAFAIFSALVALAQAGCGAPAPVRYVPPPPAARAVLVPSVAPQRASAPVERSVIDPAAAAMLEKNAAQAPVPFGTSDPPKLTLMALDTTSRSEARGLDADGPPLFSTLEEGQRSSQTISLTPGDCLTVIAHGGLGVMEVDTFLLVRNVAGIGGAPAILAQDTRDGPVALIGGQGGCFAYPGAQTTQADLVVQARRGSGPVVLGVWRARVLAAAHP